MFLQVTTTLAPTVLDRANTTLADYGLLGTFAVLMIGIILYMEKQRNKNNNDQLAKIVALEAKVDAQQKAQEAQQLAHVEFIKNEYRQSMDINRRCLELFDEIRPLLRDLRKP